MNNLCNVPTVSRTTVLNFELARWGLPIVTKQIDNEAALALVILRATPVPTIRMAVAVAIGDDIAQLVATLEHALGQAKIKTFVN